MQGNPTVQQNLESCPFEEAGTGGETAILIHVSTAMMFAAQKLEKRSVYLSHPTDTASAQTDCLLLKTAREGDASLRKKKNLQARPFFYCLHWVPVINPAKPCTQKTAFVARLLTWHGKRAKMYVDKTSKSTTCGRKGDFVKMWECIRMQEMVWWRGGLLGDKSAYGN